jgi:hypothetical protein
MIKKLLAALAVSASATLMVAGPAHAVQQRPTYQLTPIERHYACGSFGGTIIFSDNTSVDCSTGLATL